MLKRRKSRKQLRRREMVIIFVVVMKIRDNIRSADDRPNVRVNIEESVSSFFIPRSSAQGDISICEILKEALGEVILEFGEECETYITRSEKCHVKGTHFCSFISCPFAWKKNGQTQPPPRPPCENSHSR